MNLLFKDRAKIRVFKVFYNNIKKNKRKVRGGGGWYPPYEIPYVDVVGMGNGVSCCLSYTYSDEEIPYGKGKWTSSVGKVRVLPMA